MRFVVSRRYVDTYRDLQKLAACMHLSDSPPGAVVVDDVCSFADAGCVSICALVILLYLLLLPLWRPTAAVSGCLVRHRLTHAHHPGLWP